jgi:hypothetical protein
MIHNVRVDPAIYLDLVRAADDAKMTIEEFEAWAIQDAVNNHRRHKNGWNKLHDALGVIPGGD